MMILVLLVLLFPALRVLVAEEALWKMKMNTMFGVGN
jgi:hypothetical protein